MAAQKLHHFLRGNPTAALEFDDHAFSFVKRRSLFPKPNLHADRILSSRCSGIEFRNLHKTRDKRCNLGPFPCHLNPAN
ncbi:hypothetical protein ACTTAI_04055 [Rhodobacter capsulatus]|uniref:hypothetical protein n=1 Tax=Rhodobacter capsulatus TaxID=1061 RepID=UPI004027E8E9